ncbi:hypothetical protein GBAR_LOCUS26488 [Geodia barretti]|uniref:Uncharacterized protein n=1 Tax=Geodia barretti TaxID=519541 RepID=A0AA35TGJ9_GEOBA|nr:hypothetical protein GBAR_LOCUS26488 [Geodia barretti]
MVAAALIRGTPRSAILATIPEFRRTFLADKSRCKKRRRRGGRLAKLICCTRREQVTDSEALTDDTSCQDSSQSAGMYSSCSTHPSSSVSSLSQRDIVGLRDVTDNDMAEDHLIHSNESKVLTSEDTLIDQQEFDDTFPDKNACDSDIHQRILSDGDYNEVVDKDSAPVQTVTAALSHDNDSQTSPTIVNNGVF